MSRDGGPPLGANILCFVCVLLLLAWVRVAEVGCICERGVVAGVSRVVDGMVVRFGAWERIASPYSVLMDRILLI